MGAWSIASLLWIVWNANFADNMYRNRKAKIQKMAKAKQSMSNKQSIFAIEVADLVRSKMRCMTVTCVRYENFYVQL